eukprot:COSAG02_NODE_29774_length_563_cov_0.989224_1_plen_129_part_10
MLALRDSRDGTVRAVFPCICCIRFFGTPRPWLNGLSFCVWSLQADARAKVWALLRKFKQRGNLMGCASNGEEPQVARVAPQMGLVLNHAYSLLDVWEGQRRNGERIKLLKLRNPWGEGEWKGKWSAGSD